MISVNQIKLGVQRLRQIDLDDELRALELRRELPKRSLVGVRRHAERELTAEVLGNSTLVAQGGLVVQGFVPGSVAQRSSQFLGWCDLHPDQQRAALAFASRPLLDAVPDMLPATKIEVADAEIGPVADCHGVAERGQQRLLDIVEDSGHIVASLNVECRGCI